MELSKIVQNIQSILAPAIMISSSALLLLGFQNKFSALFNRFRALNEEKRYLRKKREKDNLERERLKNLEKQLAALTRRAFYVKNAIVFTYLAIVAFLITSFFIFLGIYFNIQHEHLIIFSFEAGLAGVLMASIMVVIEVGISYRILRLEYKS